MSFNIVPIMALRRLLDCRLEWLLCWRWLIHQGPWNSSPHWWNWTCKWRNRATNRAC